MTVFNSDPATQLATLSLHDALPISPPGTPRNDPPRPAPRHAVPREESAGRRAPTRRGRHLLMIRTRAGACLVFAVRVSPFRSPSSRIITRGSKERAVMPEVNPHPGDEESCEA